MTIEYRQATLEDAELLINIYNASFYSDYLNYGECPGYGKTKEMMEASISKCPKFIILCDNEPVGCVSCKRLEMNVYEVGCLCVVPEFQGKGLCTCYSGGNRWTRDENGNKLHLNLADYGVEGERESVWFVDNVKKYHRTFSTIINTLIGAGFTIEKMIEPLPTDELLEKYPDYKDLFHKPDFLLIKANK